MISEVNSESELRAFSQLWNSPVWLFAHSPPKKWPEVRGVLDPRHPTRHSIWTSVSEYMQERVFNAGPKMRLDTDQFNFQNTFLDSEHVKKNLDFTEENVAARVKFIRRQLHAFRPKIVLTFGEQAFRLVKFANNLDNVAINKPMKIEDLGEQFCKSLKNFDVENVNIIPLLHASVARKSWLTAGKKFSGEAGSDNYFRFVGIGLGDLFLSHARHWEIWN